MVQVLGRTYRIVELSAGVYDAIRLLDDVRIGKFDDGPPLHLEAAAENQILLRQIAQMAIRTARTHWAPKLAARNRRVSAVLALSAKAAVAPIISKKVCFLDAVTSFR